ncbi:Yip1 family protein [Haloarchaeobius sp. DFWS5]|uniref:Yip1 family protein n=1 Tax=Haloarchaeobius sp. DFWS5 TaxID=3446114 RepID=UPI003EB8D2AF
MVLTRYVTLLTDPERCFREEQVGLRAAFLVVGSMMIVLTVGTVFALQAIVGQIRNPPPGLGAAMSRATPRLVVSLLFGVFVLWLVGSALLHLGVKLLGGRGGFGETFVVAGCSRAPMLLQIPLSLAWVVWGLSGKQFSNDPETFAQQVQATVDGGRTVVPMLLEAGAIVVAAYIIANGLAVRHDGLTKSEAQLVAGSVGVLELLMLVVG